MKYRDLLASAVRPDVVVAALVATSLLLKIALMRPAATGPIVLAIVQHDAGIAGLMLLLHSARSAVVRQFGSIAARAISGTLFAVAACLVILYVSDVFIYFFFATRLYASDIVTMSFELQSVASVATAIARRLADSSMWVLAASGLLGLLIIRSCYLLIARPLAPTTRSRSTFLVGALCVALSVLPLPGYAYSFGDKPLYENFLERNYGFFARRGFSDAFRTRLLTADTVTHRACHVGKGRQLNIVLLIIESLSAYHSNFFSGIENWTPRLDSIARGATALTNFHANGWTTIGGLIALLSGELPLVPERSAFNTWGSPRLVDYLEITRPLPKILLDQGYTTAFIAAGDLGFLGQAQWLRRIGFQHLIGHDDPRFDEQTARGPFRSVPDRLLYRVALDELTRLTRKEPFFLVVQTYWSHRPFMTPEGGRVHGEEEVIRETDARLGDFYNALVATRFLDRSLLVITSDHRAMEPFRKGEFDRFGASAVTRIPAVVATNALHLPAVIASDFQQRDFAPSIESLTSKQYCLRPHQGTFLSDPPAGGACIIHARGDDRDRVFVKCGSDEATVLIAGDATRVQNGRIANARSVVREINLARARPRNSRGGSSDAPR